MAPYIFMINRMREVPTPFFSDNIHNRVKDNLIIHFLSRILLNVKWLPRTVAGKNHIKLI